MEDSSGPRPFLKLKLTSGKPAEDGGAVSREETSGASGNAAPSPFVSPPPGLSPSASRTAPVPRLAKPSAPGSGPPVSGTDDPALPPAPVPSGDRAGGMPASAGGSPVIAPVPGKKLRLQGRPDPESPESLALLPVPESVAPPADAGTAAAGFSGNAPASAETSPREAASSPASSVPVAISAPAAVPATGKVLPVPASRHHPGPAVRSKRIAFTVVVAVVVLVAAGVLLSRSVVSHDSGSAVSPELVAEVVETSPPVPATTGSVAASVSTKASTGEPVGIRVRARIRDEDLSRWLADSRVTSISSDRITMNRRVYSLGSPVNADGTLKWVGRDSVTGNLLFMDASGVVYEKSPR